MSRSNKHLKCFRCIRYYNDEVTHALIKGNLVDGYKELPLCPKCAKKIKDASPYVWDSNSIVAVIDLVNPSGNFSWSSYFQ